MVCVAVFQCLGLYFDGIEDRMEKYLFILENEVILFWKVPLKIHVYNGISYFTDPTLRSFLK